MPGLDAVLPLVVGGLALACALGGAAVLGLGMLRSARAPTPPPLEEAAPPARPRPVEALPRRAAPVPAPAPPPRADLTAGIAKSRGALFGRLHALLRGRGGLDPATVEEIETVLFGADIGVRTAEELLGAARGARAPGEVLPALERRALEILRGLPTAAPPEPAGTKVTLVVGVNGSGKTTTIAKLAARRVRSGGQVLLAAADTYRAAAVDQLGVWAERAGCELVKGQPGSDPASVAFDAVKTALARGADEVIVDTAGRLQTQANLMEELSKISRVVAKDVPGAPHEVLLVLDANTGQNAIRQAQEFSRAVRVTGIVLAKLDGTAKGGVVLGIAREVGIPVRYVGIGEGLDDLYDFDAEEFVRALLAPGRGGDGGEAVRPRA